MLNSQPRQLFPMQFPLNPPKQRTPQSIRDNEKVRKRMKINGPKVEKVSNFIDKLFGTHVTIAILTSLAKLIINKHALVLDRLARRNRSALLCWYAENWDIIHPMLTDSKFATKIKIMKQGLIKQKITKKDEQAKKDMFFDPTDLNVLLNFH